MRPGEFLYEQNAAKRWPRMARRIGKAVLGYDLALPDETIERFAAMYYDADPLAEAFVDEIYLGRSMEQGRAMLDQALTEGVDSIADAPQSLVDLFADIEHAPEWVDNDKVALGARVFRRYGTAVFRFAGAITLAAYSENSVAKPLILTGAYAGSSTKHRFLETAAFWIAVSNPHGLEPGAPGRASALRVRIMHVFVRRNLLRHAEWDSEAWGVPISQADALLTLMGGSVYPGLGLRAMGFRPTRTDVEAMMHFWRYVGHLMGVRPSWFPETIEQAYQLLYVTFVKKANRAGNDGRKLCQSYVDAFKPDPDHAPRSLLERVRAHVEHRVHLGYTRFFMPPPDYRFNQLPPAGIWALVPLAQFPLIFGLETMRRRSRALDNLADRVARWTRDRWFARHSKGRAAEYRPVRKFTR